MLNVYSRRNCERCARVKKQLSEKEISYSELIIGEQVDRDTVLSMFPGATALPILCLDGKQVTIEEL